MSGNTLWWLVEARRAPGGEAAGNEANDLRVPDNITLIPLPSYSPELNPVERLWLSG